MSKRPSGLGRGLDALIPRASPAGATRLPIRQLHPNADQPRRRFDESSLQDLAASIREKGVIQPLLVRPKGTEYEIVAGERRWRAAGLAGLTEVPVVVRELSDRETLELAIIENLQREDLGPVEEARAYARLLEFGLTQDEAARAVGKGRSTVANALRLLSLPPNALAALEDGRITAGHARAVLALPEEERDAALERILAGNLSVREAEALRSAPAPRKEKAPAARAHRQLELELSRYAGTRVRIHGEEKGRLELYYHTQEDLNRLLELLGYEP